MDQEYQVATPENVPISYELSGVGSRFVAALLDSLIMLAIQAGVTIVIAIIAIAVAAILKASSEVDLDLVGFAAMAIVLLAYLAVTLGYSLLFEIAWNGQTPGKRKMSIRVIRDDGGPITALAAIIRNVLRLADFLPAYYIIGVVTMLMDRKCRRLGDMAAGTICVRERKDVAVDRLLPSRPTRRFKRVWPPRADLGGLAQLSYEDQHLVKEYLLRRDQLAPGPGRSLAEHIAGRISTRLGADLAGETAEDFLARVGSELEHLSR